MTSIAIASGKGGVGKSTLTLNLGYLASESYKTLLIDCDLELANLDILAGIKHSATMHDIFTDQKDFSSVAIPLTEKLDLIPSATGVVDSSILDPSVIDIFFRNNQKELSDYGLIFYDMGAGITASLIHFMSYAKYHIIVVTPEPTSIADAYALIKVLHVHYALTNVYILINMMYNEEEVQNAFTTISTALQHFLGITAELLGYVPHDLSVMDCVQKQMNFVHTHTTSPATQSLRNIFQKIEKQILS